jgi:hypothetical protein
MPDRYADAVRARRAELRAMRLSLVGGHRAELRSCLALSRLTAAADIEQALAQLRREMAEHCDAGDRAARARLLELLAAAVPHIAEAVDTRWTAGLRPGLRRIGTERGLDLGAGWPRLPAPHLPGRPPDVPASRRPGAVRSLLAGALDGAALWRLALFPLAVLPLLGLPVLGGPAFAPLALGAGVAAVVGTAVARRTAAERARLRLVAEQAVTAAGAALHSDLARRLVEVERSVGAALDAAVLRRRAAVDAELASLAPDRPQEASRG